MTTLEEVVALGREAFPGHYVAVNLGQSTYGYPTASVAVLTISDNKWVARLQVDGSQGTTASDALSALVEEMEAGRWVLESPPAPATEAVGL